MLMVSIISVTVNDGLAQTYSFGFRREYTIPVFKDSVNQFKYPWAGGFNSAHFNSIDLNFDGIKDLVVFDINTERVLPFLNMGTPNQPNYNFAPQYERNFPKISGWMQLRDFNGDGKEDIFCYAYGAIRVYKNVSVNDTLKFSLHTPILLAWEGVFPTNIMVTDFDYPAIGDIDNDGDLDIIVPAGLGGVTMHYYKNLAIENTGSADTLWFVLKNRCYGWFAENDTSNQLILNIDTIDPTMINYCITGFKKGAVKQGGAKHTGSTCTMIDLNGDNLKDILLGDTDYPNVAALILQGHVDTPRVASYETNFPSYNVPIDLYSLPTVDVLDVDNDGLKDLLVGAMDPAWEVPKAENAEGAWWYKNIGTNSNPVFSLQTKTFLQDQMIDVGSNSHPVLFDYNNNGLLDLFVGTFGLRDSSWMDPWLNLYSKYVSRIALFENIGTATQPAFRLVDDDFANVSSLGLVGAYPTFGDLNGDGKPDMLLGDTTGRLHLFLNSAPTGYPMSLNYASSNYQGIDVGQYGTPQLFDLDKDGLDDLIMGYRRGTFVDTNTMVYSWKTSLAYFRNTGTLTQPQFTLMTDTLGGVNVNDSYYHFYDGYSAPCFFRDSSGTTHLFVGSGTGMIFYYNNIDGNLTGIFGKDTNMVHTTDYDKFYSVLFLSNDDGTVMPVDMRRKSVVTVGNLNGDQYPDMIVGNFSGGLNYFSGIQAPGVGIKEVTKAFSGDLIIYPNPAQYLVNVAITGADPTAITTTSVYSLTGQLLLQVERRGEDVYSVNIQDLANGLYILRVDLWSQRDGTRATFNRKLIVKR